jgi:hypothetical protein
MENKAFTKHDWAEWVQFDVIPELCDMYETNASEFIYDDYMMGDAMREMIANQCIYYADCWDIARELGANSFDIESTGEIAQDICELSYYTLLEFAETLLYSYKG